VRNCQVEPSPPKRAGGIVTRGQACCSWPTTKTTRSWQPDAGFVSYSDGIAGVDRRCVVDESVVQRGRPKMNEAAIDYAARKAAPRPSTSLRDLRDVATAISAAGFKQATRTSIGSARRFVRRLITKKLSTGHDTALLPVVDDRGCVGSRYTRREPQIASLVEK